MHIGLIGGIGPAATDFYYRRLISTFASKARSRSVALLRDMRALNRQFKASGPLSEWHYASHEAVFAVHGGEMMGGQDQLWKFTIPRSERDRVLAYLDAHNLNAYSLFGSEESLMEMMAQRELR